MSVSISEQITCVRRELGYRENVYPRLVQAKKMRPEVADKELARMRAVLATLEGLQAQAAPKLDLGAAA